MEMPAIETLIEKNAHPIRNRLDISSLITDLGNSKIVMLGESSHGTQEFYQWRRLITQELILRYGFNFIAVEGDWPPSAELNNFILNSNNSKNENGSENIESVLKSFQRWPTWMWANTEIVKLTEWLRNYNQERPKEKKIGFYGLDVYSLFESIDEVLVQLKKIDPALAQKVKMQYECFEPFDRDERAYAKHLYEFPKGCETQVLNVLTDLLKVRINKIDEKLFDAQQNARIVKNAEQYYRTMIQGEDSWNVRDRHMTETLEILLNRYGTNSKAIVWAHNTHIGDYRATNMVQEGQINIGGLAREKWGEVNVSLLGFGTYEGTVIASLAWDGPIEVMRVPPARPTSYEDHFHNVSTKLRQNAFYVWLKDELRESLLTQVLGHRAIGVVYQAAYERFGNYVPTSLSKRYDAFIFIDKTNALTPLNQEFNRNEIPETWPRGV